ncbi:MAG: hypothetical protein QG574_934 [Cyanobacteriota bacterium erpe_2018_sw_21hr_WHONDRS-SW48-000092_B_bin.40]|nr:hypothetical protein [Cyanobacteriota bacterium erpe_2018_sw_21hr_WHONDRS-SW48-000092_B_bin.40]
MTDHTSKKVMGLDPLQIFGLSFTAAALLAVLFVILIHPMRIGFDQAKYLIMADMLWHGKTLYVDIIDLNPPLICYISLIPSLASALFNIPASLAFSLFIWSLSVYCVTAIYALATKAKEQLNWPLINTFTLSIATYEFMLTTNRLRFLFEWGQREHIFMLSYWPFFILRYLRWQQLSMPPWLAIPVGAIAGCGMCLKPYFFIPAILTELYWLIQSKERAIRPFLKVEIAAAAAVAALYTMHFKLLSAAEQHAYFDLLMPLTISGYKFFERSTVYLCNYNFTCSEDVLIHSLCCAALTFALVRLEPFLAPVCVVMFSSYFIYFIQGKGFPLHLFPLNQSAFILQNTILIALYKTIKEQVVQTRLFNQTHLGGKKWLIGTLALTALTAWLADSCWKDYKQEASSNQFDLASIGYKGHASAEDLAPLAKPIIEYTKVGDYVAIIGESTEPNATTILQLRRKSATRHIDLTMLGPFRFVRDNVPQVWQKFPNQLNEFIDQLVQDLKETSPTIVLLQNGQTTDWLSEYKFSQRSLNNYEQIGEEDNFTIYKKKGCFKINEMWVSGPTKPK